MKWILIWFVTTADGGGSGSAEFNNYESCKNAIEMVEVAYGRWDARAFAFCVQKGRE